MITLAANAALAANAQVIRVLRLVGARDSYIARAFVRRFTLRALSGAAVGTVAGHDRRGCSCPSTDTAGGFLTGLGFQGLGWLWPLALPPLAAVVAFVATRASALPQTSGTDLMPKPIQWLLSLIFIVQMYLAMAVIALVFAALRAVLAATARSRPAMPICRWVRFIARLLCGLQTEVRGTVPTGEVLIAAKHQSFLDIILIYGAVPRAKFIMKARAALWRPILGWYALRIGCVPVNRGKRGAAITKMKADVKSGAGRPRPVDHLPAGHPRRPRRNRALQGRHRRALQPAGPALRSGRRPMSACSGPSAASCATAAARWWSSCPQSRPACPMPTSWPELEDR